MYSQDFEKELKFEFNKHLKLSKINNESQSTYHFNSYL